ncbi:MAG: hypothetical protein JWM90_2708 [Thermoleophilia bacterium]|nr:hypothetical protein [Thermoleophilia bacterium]
MNAYTKLPAPLRFGIPVVLVFVLGLVLWMTMFKPPVPVSVMNTQDFGTYDVAKQLLDTEGINYKEASDKGRFELLVAPDEKSAADQLLAKNGLQDRTGLAKKISCPAAPGFTANKAKTTEYNNCEDSKKVQNMLLQAGALAASVTVSQEENGTLIGPETSKNVSAMVFLPPSMENGGWDATNAAQQIKGAVGTSIDRIYIGDDKMQPLFDGAKGEAAATSAVASGNGCADMANAAEIATKEAAVRSCYEGTIATKLSTLLGGSDRFVLVVDAKVDAVSTSTQAESSTAGPIVSSSSQTGAGSTVKDVTTPPNTKVTSSSKAAGDIGKLAISVSLDKNNVNANQELAVKRMLQTYVNASRKDPSPVVTRFAFPKGTGIAPKATAAPQLATGGSENEAPILAATKTETPKPVLALLAVLAIGLAAAMIIMWRKSVAMKQERARMEQAFQNDQRLFENFAQQNPEALAQDLEALFGAPAAQR